MTVEFNIKLTSMDLYRFNMYQTYSGFQGIFSIVMGIMLLALSVTRYGEVEMMYTVLYVVFGVIFLFYQPISLYLRVKHSIAASEVLSNTLHYMVDDKGIHVSQGEANAELLWEQVYKMVATKSNVLIYSNRINAYVVPREQLGDAYQPLAKIANEKLQKYRVKMR